MAEEVAGEVEVTVCEVQHRTMRCDRDRRGRGGRVGMDAAVARMTLE